MQETHRQSHLGVVLTAQTAARTGINCGEKELAKIKGFPQK